MSKVPASERMERKEFEERYETKVCERLTEARLAVEEGVSVSEVFWVFKDAVIAAMQVWWDGRRNKRDGYERQVCHTVTY